MDIRDMGCEDGKWLNYLWMVFEMTAGNSRIEASGSPA
jgi:hypothetical protein